MLRCVVFCAGLPKNAKRCLTCLDTSFFSSLLFCCRCFVNLFDFLKDFMTGKDYQCDQLKRTRSVSEPFPFMISQEQKHK